MYWIYIGDGSMNWGLIFMGRSENLEDLESLTLPIQWVCALAWWVRQWERQKGQGGLEKTTDKGICLWFPSWAKAIHSFIHSTNILEYQSEAGIKEGTWYSPPPTGPWGRIHLRKHPLRDPLRGTLVDEWDPILGHHRIGQYERNMDR